jgi:ABC-type amino acid transport substrate-binding protein
MTSEFYGVVLSKENLELKRKIDASLTELLRNGRVQKLHQKWNLGKFSIVPLPE